MISSRPYLPLFLCLLQLPSFSSHRSLSSSSHFSRGSRLLLTIDPFSSSFPSSPPWSLLPCTVARGLPPTSPSTSPSQPSPASSPSLPSPPAYSSHFPLQSSTSSL